MGEPNLVRTLETKRKEIERTIRAYEKQIEICRRDLSHINAKRWCCLSDQRSGPNSRST